jgi:hypothetical protein
MTAREAIKIIRRTNNNWRFNHALSSYEYEAEKAGRKPSPTVRAAWKKGLDKKAARSKGGKG